MLQSKQELPAAEAIFSRLVEKAASAVQQMRELLPGFVQLKDHMPEQFLASQIALDLLPDYKVYLECRTKALKELTPEVPGHKYGRIDLVIYRQDANDTDKLVTAVEIKARSSGWHTSTRQADRLRCITATYQVPTALLYIQCPRENDPKLEFEDFCESVGDADCQFFPQPALQNDGHDTGGNWGIMIAKFEAAGWQRSSLRNAGLSDSLRNRFGTRSESAGPIA